MNLRYPLAAALSVSLWVNNLALADVVVCPLDEAMRRLEDYNRNLNAELAQKQIPILTDIQALTSKAKNPALPTGAQLSKTDQDRFQQLREQLLTLPREVVGGASDPVLGDLGLSLVLARSAV